MCCISLSKMISVERERERGGSSIKLDKHPHTEKCDPQHAICCRHESHQDEGEEEEEEGEGQEEGERVSSKT